MLTKMGPKKILLVVCCLGPFLTGLIYGRTSDVATSVEVSADEGLSTIPVVLDLKRPSDTDILKLRNGDQLTGTVLNENLSVAATYAKIPVDLSQVDSISFIGGRNVLTKITMVNGDVVQGVLETEDIELSLDVGGDVKVYQDRVDTLCCKTGYVPEGFLSIAASSQSFRGRSLLSESLRGKSVVLDLGGGVELKFALIPAGEFLMGSAGGESDRRSDEGPQHQVKLTQPFYMLTTEVTQQQYSQIMGTNPSKFKGTENPVETVSWNDAVEFCRKLSEKAERQISLPTEAQWEYACRAGTNTRFCFGEDDQLLGSYSWYQGNSNSQTHAVATKQPNAWGLYDMHGNVWEWCSDWYDGNYYSSSPSVDPNGPSSGSSRVLRGGSWYANPVYCRSAYRSGIAPDNRDCSRGFRVVLDLKLKSSNF